MRLPVVFLLWLLSLPAYGQLPYVPQGPSQGLYEGQLVLSLIHISAVIQRTSISAIA